ncbi:Ubiquitin-like-specific protease 2 [Candida viswanathii]|uniref:Ubiquitin-like-specific protease 2 n=1 Tax=Candida viswanathii TaxID=5486 RepID=A0A367XLR1_9ASCO|nr:Ubiquitin-like-specific protease 2 [Candida viswanathii]
MSDIKKKDYPSLRRKGASIGGGGNYTPFNTLEKTSRVPISESQRAQDSAVDVKGTTLIGNPTVLGDPHRTMERAQARRERLSGLTTSSTRPVLTSSSSKEHSEGVLDCYGSSIDAQELGLNDEPAVSIDLKSLRKVNGEFFRTGNNNHLSMGIAKDGQFICMYREGTPKSGYVIDMEKQLKSLSFALESIVIELNDLKDTIIATHYGRDQEIREYFQKNPCDKVDPSKTLSDAALDKINQKVEGVINPSYQERLDEIISSRNDQVLDEMFSKLRTRRAKKAFWDNITQGKATAEDSLNDKDPPVIESIFLDDDYVPWEEPANFDPDLQYVFPDGKLFRVAHNDFATLYNNSWINDAVMDFCIKYDIEEAIEAGIVKRDEIHAFNSFFYTKLSTQTKLRGEPDYYQNIKRWVQKLDLMSIPYLVMPINEKHHWYCCIIRGLPGLLQSALKSKKDESNTTKNSTPELSRETSFQEPQASSQLPPSGSETDEQPKKECAEIFVFDSLGLKRDNVRNPLRSFIIDYCKDKYDVEIQKDQIRVISARVPRQNNYNDCGMHVIYNVKKWLFNLEACESLWKKHQFSVQRSIFVTEERNNIRRHWIDLFLQLHSQQQASEAKLSGDGTANGDSSSKEQERPKEPGPTDKEKKDDDDDDDVIEIIEEKKIAWVTSPTTAIASRTRNSLGRAFEPKFENNYLNETYAHQSVPPYVVKTLNAVLPQRTLHLEMNVKKLIERFINKVKRGPYTKDDAKESFVAEFRAAMEESETGNRPKNKSFKIEEQVTSGVSHLTIAPGTFFTKLANGARQKLLDPKTAHFLTEKSITRHQQLQEVEAEVSKESSKTLLESPTRQGEGGTLEGNRPSTRFRDRENARGIVDMLQVNTGQSPKRRRLE